MIENPRWLRNNLVKLRKVQRHASRQTKGSNCQRKTYKQIAKLHEIISNQRLDYLHKASSKLVKENDLIAIEDLTLGFMNKNRRLALSSHDAGLGILRQLLEYKAEDAGIQLIAVNPYNTTQACSRCSEIVPKKLSVRVHNCPNCGLLLDRDVNAAVNILGLALQIPLGRSGQSLTCSTRKSVDCEAVPL
jgi:putative transposase